MAIGRCNDENYIRIGFKHIGSIRNQAHARTSRLNLLPDFLATSAHVTQSCQTSRNQSIQRLEIGPNHVPGSDYSDRHWMQDNCSSRAAGAGSKDKMAAPAKASPIPT